VYALVENDWKYETLKAKKGQVVANFIVDHSIELDHNVCMAEESAWKLFFNRSVCSHGQGVGCLIMSPNGVEHELSIQMEFEWTNNQSEHEALLNGLEMLFDMEAKSVEAYGDSKLVVQQMNGESQCQDEVLNEYLERCLDALDSLERVSIYHVPHEDNVRANTLVQVASGYDIRHGKFEVKRRPTSHDISYTGS
jgi:ribonuclease HI